MEKAIRAIRTLRAAGWATDGRRVGGGVYVAEARCGGHRACVAARSPEDAWPELWVLVATVRQSHRVGK